MSDTVHEDSVARAQPLSLNQPKQGQASSTLSINEGQHAVYKDADNDVIEDLSEDAALDNPVLAKHLDASSQV